MVFRFIRGFFIKSEPEAIQVQRMQAERKFHKLIDEGMSLITDPDTGEIRLPELRPYSFPPGTFHSMPVDHIFDLIQHLKEQQQWSLNTFGPPNNNTAGIIDHIKKELVEVADKPEDVFEWIDIVILAFDGALRNGWSPKEIADALKTKHEINEARKWPDWRTVEKGKAICHIKEEDPAKIKAEMEGCW
jgi:hypothetical protein